MDTDRLIYREYFVYEDGAPSISEGKMVSISDSKFLLADEIDKKYHRRTVESISRITGWYYYLRPSNSGNDLVYEGKCLKTDESVPRSKLF
jgi:hypothetical protein